MKKVILGCTIVVIVLISISAVSCSNITQTKIGDRRHESNNSESEIDLSAKLNKMPQEAQPTKSAREKANSNARKMLKKYNLQPAAKMEAEISQSVLIERLFDKKYFPKFNAASKAIGLDLNKCRGKNIWIGGYSVRQLSKYEPVGPRVGFVFDEQGSIYGAFMDIANLLGSYEIVPIGDQSKIVSVAADRNLKH